jgi:hypothetical protein
MRFAILAAAISVVALDVLGVLLAPLAGRLGVT